MNQRLSLAWLIIQHPPKYARLQEVKVPQCIESGGISGMVGHAADAKAQLCMQRLNIDMSPHIAQKINAEHLKKADLVLVMSNNQQKHIVQTWPFAKGKVFRLGHWQQKNVPDPYQHDQTFFDETSLLIQQCTADWNNHI